MKKIWDKYRNTLLNFAETLPEEKGEILKEIIFHQEKEILEAEKYLNKIEQNAKKGKITENILTLFLSSMKENISADGMLSYIVQIMGRAFGAERGFFLLNPSSPLIGTKFLYLSSGRLKTATPEEIKYSNTIITHIIDTGKPLLVANALSDEKFSKKDSIRKLKILSVLAFPVKDENGSVKGIIYFDSRNVENLFSNEQKEIGEKIVAVAEKFLHLLQPEILLEPPVIYQNVVIGKSKTMQKIFTQIQAFASSDINVLFIGESGAGKEIMARLLHKISSRKLKPFIPVHCGAIPESLLESELFGYKKGAFTGATSDKKGYVESANGGTLFLDEIDTMPLSLQIKILRFVEHKEFNRLGDSVLRKVNIRLLSASNRNLEKLEKKGKFRSDLYYRISPAIIEIPPLRKRKEDIPIFLQYFASKKGKKISVGATKLLLDYDYPGNVRELSNIIDYAYAVSRGDTIRVEDLPSRISQKIPAVHKPSGTNLKDIEKEIIQSVLKNNKGNISQTASELGISRTTLYKKIQDYKLNAK